MQAITVAIGPAGVTYFANELVAVDLISALSQLKPPDRNIPIGRIDIDYSNAQDIRIRLNDGSLSNFSPTFQQVGQGSGGQFAITLQAASFEAVYNWEETYKWTFCYNAGGQVGILCDPTKNKDKSFTYKPSIGGLTVSVPTQFKFDATSQSWQIAVGTSSGSTSNVKSNIPSDSILHEQDQECFSSHVDDATAQSIASIDFSSAIQAVLPPMFKSIPESGHLTQDIVYDFGLGDSGLNFPGDNGLTVGVTGSVTYKGTPYPGTPPASLPVPPV
nr:hypothetical protein [Chloroflexota bacterium]